MGVPYFTPATAPPDADTLTLIGSPQPQPLHRVQWLQHRHPLQLPPLQPPLPLPRRPPRRLPRQPLQQPLQHNQVQHRRQRERARHLRARFLRRGDTSMN